MYSQYIHVFVMWSSGVSCRSDGFTSMVFAIGGIKLCNARCANITKVRRGSICSRRVVDG